MARHAPLDAALKRLSSALDQLEAASARLRATGAEKRDLADALAAMQDDRGQLAEDLDVSLTRTRMLEQATDEVARRLGQAGHALRRLVAAQGDAAHDGAIQDGAIHDGAIHDGAAQDSGA